MQTCHLGGMINQTVLTFNNLAPTGQTGSNLRRGEVAVSGSEKDRETVFKNAYFIT